VSGVRGQGTDPLTPSLSVEIAGIQFKNPVLAAPGPLGFGRDVQSVIDLETFGGFVTKSVTVQPRTGNPYPQIVQTPSGRLNSLGLPNHGLGAFITKDLPFLRTLALPIVVSVAGESIDEFVTLVEWVSQEHGVAAVEVNVACPNVHAGLMFGVDANLTYELISTLRGRSPRPVFVKLTPNVTDIAAVARAAEDAGADALSLINTMLGLAIDVDSRRPKLGGVTGGLSGPAVRPVAVRMVWDVARACRIPVIGMGGIASAEDALEFFIAGARAVAVGSAVIDNPNIASQLCNGLLAYLQKNGMSSINEVVGTLRVEASV
jgi:dihydroorotate dehydrogenase (NAD+) catalytic subunit